MEEEQIGLKSGTRAHIHHSLRQAWAHPLGPKNALQIKLTQHKSLKKNLNQETDELKTKTLIIMGSLVNGTHAIHVVPSIKRLKSRQRKGPSRLKNIRPHQWILQELTTRNQNMNLPKYESAEECGPPKPCHGRLFWHNNNKTKYQA